MDYHPNLHRDNLRMYDQFNEHRRRLQGCEKDEMEAQVTLRFDAKPKQTSAAFIEWGLQDGYSIQLLQQQENSHIAFANELFSHTFCFPTITAYEFRIEDDDEIIQTPGYDSLAMNGRQLVSGNIDTFILFAGGLSVCGINEARVELRIQFGNYSHLVEWEFLRNQEVVVNADVTYNAGANQYQANSRHSFLINACREMATTSLFYLQQQKSLWKPHPLHFESTDMRLPVEVRIWSTVSWLTFRSGAQVVVMQSSASREVHLWS
jgi:hypothetical protein